MDIIEADRFEILVGRSAAENEQLSLGEARPTDLWLHAAGYAGSHVIVRARDGRTGEVPTAIIEHAARLAVWHSKARTAGGKVAVHLCRARDVGKRSGSPTGQVTVRRHDTVKVYAPAREPGAS
jgi:predicted ribosome quality control (RQC) complex YloA/Tae2 family protein